MLNAGTRTNGTGQTMAFDAAGRQKAVSTISRRRVGIYAMASFENVISEGFDGDGHPLKEENLGRRLNMSPPQPLAGESKYQIWSSVLNSAITETNSTGAKKTTKIFAGGAVIAEQTLFIGSQVIWKSADPVTGSTIRLRQNGVTYADENEESEPLGQLVSPVHPYEEMPEPGPSVALHTVDEPEWLCGLVAARGASFHEIPTSCKIIAFESGTATFNGLRPLSSVTQVPAGSNHSPGQGEGARPTLKTLKPKEKKRARALAASQKPSDTDNETFVDRDRPTTIGADASQQGDGGSPNTMTEFGDCLALSTPAFDNIAKPAATLLSSSYGDQARAKYNAWSIYEKAVFLNTVVGAAYFGAKFDNAKLGNEPFLVEENNFGINTMGQHLPFGIWVSGFTGISKPFLGIPGSVFSSRTGSLGSPASLETEKENGTYHMDMDLFRGPSEGHSAEIDFNKNNGVPTHPGDVLHQLHLRDPSINTGVSCVNIIPDFRPRWTGREG